MKSNSTNILRDYFNDSVDVNAPYTKDELLTLCFIDASYTNDIFDVIAVYPKSLSHNIARCHLVNILDGASNWRGNSDVFDKISEVAAIFNVDILSLFEHVPNKCIQALKDNYVINCVTDQVDIKLVDIIRDQSHYGSKYIFEINGTRYCMMNEISYDINKSLYYFESENINIYLGKWYILIDIYNSGNSDYCQCYYDSFQRTLVVNNVIDVYGFSVYEFDDEFKAKQLFKIYEANPELFYKLAENYVC